MLAKILNHIDMQILLGNVFHLNRKYCFTQIFEHYLARKLLLIYIIIELQKKIKNKFPKINLIF